MKSPFPGMDPFIEGSADWGDFHQSLIVRLKGVLMRAVPERYIVRGEYRDRVEMVETEGKEKHKFEHGELSATVVGTPPTASSTQFYVICFIASGSTSKAFQAVNNSGNLCVIKMYVKRYEEKFWIDENEFATNAAESVEREVGNRISI